MRGPGQRTMNPNGLLLPKGCSMMWLREFRRRVRRRRRLELRQNCPHEMHWSRHGPLCSRCGYLPELVRVTASGPRRTASLEPASIPVYDFLGQTQIGDLLKDDTSISAH